MKNSNLLLILTGKTASGKDTVMAKLLSRLPNLKRVVTTTSRIPRNGEKNKVDYNFISEADFRHKIAKKDFLEYVEYGGNLYGTERPEITNNLSSSLIWRIDPSRAGQIRGFIKNSFDPHLAQDLLKKVVVVYLTAPDEIILERLKERGLSEEEIKNRLQDDVKFWQEFKDNYDFIVENVPGKLDGTVDKIVSILERG